MRLGSFVSCLISGTILIAAFVAPSAARSVTATAMYKILKRNPYTLELGRDTKVEDFGKLCTAQKCYEIGLWMWKTETHRAQRILVFEIDPGKLTYLGGYRVDPRPVAIVASKILFPFPKDIGNEIEFGASGPPSQAWVGGENPELFK